MKSQTGTAIVIPVNTYLILDMGREQSFYIVGILRDHGLWGKKDEREKRSHTKGCGYGKLASTSKKTWGNDQRL